jgi:hypothetical protein
MPYSSLFKCKRIHTYLLQDPTVVEELMNEGYRYIRKYHFSNFHEITRYPTIGCVVELYAVNVARSVRIDSKEGKKLINKKCYF